jgi:hypothetical protein
LNHRNTKKVEEEKKGEAEGQQTPGQGKFIRASILSAASLTTTLVSLTHANVIACS